jgi:hypothetical protein
MEDFDDKLKSRWPKMYSDTSDVWVGPGWQPIVMALSGAIQEHIDFVEKRRSWFINKGDVPNFEPVEQVKVSQIKEKFGGLRFYYDGGDSAIAGMVTMAEHWADHTCEVCGNPGHNRTDLSWYKTLCDVHYAVHKHEKEY